MRAIRFICAPVTMYVLLFLYIIAMAVATFVENSNGSAFVRENFYYAGWFIAIELLLSVSLISAFVCRKWFSFRNIGSAILHLSFLFIMTGAAVTHYFGYEGIIHIREGEKVSAMFVGSNMERQELPFSVELTDFRLKRYHGSQSPSGYESDIVVYLNGTKQRKTVWMNNVVNIDGYRLFQSSFDKDERGSILTVSYDFPGMQITYFGYLLMIIGFLIVCFDKKSRFGQTCRALNRGGGLKMILLLLCISSITTAQASSVSKEHAAKFGELLVQNPNGRLEPVNTWTGEIMRKIHQSDNFEGINADQLFLNLIAFPNEWAGRKLIKVKNNKLLDKIGRSGSEYIAWEDVFDQQGRYVLANEVESTYSKSPSDRSSYDNDLLKLDEVVNILYQIQQGAFLAIFPHETDSTGKWYSAADDLSSFTGKDSMFVSKIMIWYTEELYNSAQTGDWRESDRVLSMIKTYQHTKNRVIPVDQKRIDAEIYYNKVNIFSFCRKWYLILGGVLLLLVFVSMINGSKLLKRLCMVLTCAIGAIFLYQTFGLALRWYIAGYAPWTNSYESMVYVGWMIVLAGFILARRFYVLPALAALLSGVILFVAGLNHMNPTITPLVPVLQSYWLMLHVAVIMAGYGFFSISALCGVFNLSLMGVAVGRNRESIGRTVDELTLLNEMAMILGLIFMTTGTFLGAIWANESWGRYWGWDPKETWALISVIVYAMVLHIRFIPKFKVQRYVFNLLSVVAVTSILMTYFGVNYYLSGLHSYGKTDSVLLPTPFIIGGAVIITIAVVAYLNQTKERSKKKIE